MLIYLWQKAAAVIKRPILSGRWVFVRKPKRDVMRTAMLAVGTGLIR